MNHQEDNMSIKQAFVLLAQRLKFIHNLNQMLSSFFYLKQAYSPMGDDYTIYTEILQNLTENSFNYGNELIRVSYQQASFDIAISCGVLEHIREFNGDNVKSLSGILEC